MNISRIRLTAPGVDSKDFKALMKKHDLEIDESYAEEEDIIFVIKASFTELEEILIETRIEWEEA